MTSLPPLLDKLEVHKRIYLSPDCECYSESRMWCQDDQGVCDECNAPWTEYVLASEHEAAIRAERERALEGVRKVFGCDEPNNAYYNLGAAISDLEHNPIAYDGDRTTSWNCDAVCLKTLKRVESQLAAVHQALKNAGGS